MREEQGKGGRNRNGRDSPDGSNAGIHIEVSGRLKCSGSPPCMMMAVEGFSVGEGVVQQRFPIADEIAAFDVVPSERERTGPVNRFRRFARFIEVAEAFFDAFGHVVNGGEVFCRSVGTDKNGWVELCEKDFRDT